MRRAALALTGVVAGTTLLISLKSAPGAVRTPDQVLADQAAARRAAHVGASPLPTLDSPLPTAGPSTGPGPVNPPPAGPTGGSGSGGSSGGGSSGGGSGSGGSSGGGTGGGSGGGPAPQPSPTTTQPPASGQITGDSAFTEFGYVTVAITVSNGRITDMTALELPGDEPRSVTISERAGPLLRQRALTAQGTNFDIVSGATWTSNAYKESLQSAIDKAGL